MADRTVVAGTAGSDPGERGALTVRARVYDQLATYAALTTDGVVRHASGLDRVIGRDLPRVQTHVNGGRIRAELDIAVAWPHSVAAVAAAVRDTVRAQLERCVDMHVVRIDVRVPMVLPPGATAPSTPPRRVL